MFVLSSRLQTGGDDWTDSVDVFYLTPPRSSFSSFLTRGLVGWWDSHAVVRHFRPDQAVREASRGGGTGRGRAELGRVRLEVVIWSGNLQLLVSSQQSHSSLLDN